MEQAAALETVRRNVFIVPTRNGIAAQNRIAVMPFIVYRIFSIGKIGPHRIRQKLVLRAAAASSRNARHAPYAGRLPPAER